jgi:hypothetical protein
VTVAIFTDTCNRRNVPFLTKPWLASFIWGSLYYIWMCVIGNVSKNVVYNFSEMCICVVVCRTSTLMVHLSFLF